MNSVEFPGLDALIHRALEEDLGLAGDVTSAATIPPETRATGRIFVRKRGVVAGIPIAQRVFELVDPKIDIRLEYSDGTLADPGTTILKLEGPARSILSGERTALNFLGHLSGIATATYQLVERIAGTSAQVIDTRKTTPGLRSLEKYAVRCGGGKNHRFGLFDAVLIKDNHLRAAGGVIPAVQRAKAHVGHMTKVEVEVESMEQLEEALQAKADIIMLDNMTPAQTRQAVQYVRGRALLESSGGITLDTIREYAETGVDLISVGWITHSATNLDVSLDLT
ncbi:MAG: carboxylating nicotinate-nucleotide diphosphorylase [Armatimonadetes bacterium]|nr:carboxylating nicotinate-nucleotide diphosphorylase [Armatimonadota bacterium]